MTTRTRFAAPLAAVLLCSGCAGITTEKKEQLVDRAGIDVIGSPADREQVVIKDASSTERFCKGPGPDVATTASKGIDLGLSGAPGIPAGGKVGDSASRGAMDLGGRSPAVLLARELLYRACELIINTNPDTTTSISIYKMTMDSIERIAALQTGSGSAAASAAPPPASAGLPDDMPGVSQSTGTAASQTPPTTPTNDATGGW